jgi:hypothetical protein
MAAAAAKASSLEGVWSVWGVASDMNRCPQKIDQPDLFGAKAVHFKGTGQK